MVRKHFYTDSVLFSYWISGFFDYPYLQKELIDWIDFLHRHSHQRNDQSEINTFSWLWRALPSHTQVSWNFPKSVIRSYKGWNDLKTSLENESNIYFIHKIPTIITKMVSSNQVVGFFDHWYHLKESMNVFKVFGCSYYPKKE